MPENVQVHWDWFPYGLLGYVLYNVGLFCMLRKAGYTAWLAFVPLYNFYLTVKLAGWRGWSVLWLLIPVINIFAFIVLCGDIARSFGRGVFVTLGLVFFFPFLVLALGLDRWPYLGRIAGPARL